MKKYVVSILTFSTFLIYIIYGRTVNTLTPNNISQITQTNSVVPTNSIVSSTAPPTTLKNSKSKPTTTPGLVAVSSTPTPTPQGQYKDGQYTGSSADAYYGNVQVKAVIQNGQLSDIVILDYPQDRGRSVAINTQAMPYLVQEAIQAQSANVNTISGATDSSGAFVQSLSSALDQARI